MIEVADRGRYTTIQDRGRPGFERFGIPPGGVADWFAAAVANRLVGNASDASLIECTANGPSLRFERDATIAIAGGASSEAGFPGWQAQQVDAGSIVRFGPVTSGLRSYIAIRGGIDVPVVLGSRSLCAAGAFGGGVGRALQGGDRLPIGDAVDAGALERPWPASHRLPPRGPWEIHVIAGPHRDAFEPSALHRLTATACRVTPALDRVGVRLDTPGLHLDAAEVLTTPVTAGAIQVTPSGGLIALLADHPTTGGYPVIATVTTADLPLLAQARPGDTVRFREATLAEAARAHRRVIGWLDLDA
jgi:antagonist of KipI